MKAYLISMALFVSGIATFIQIQKIFGSAITTGGLTAIFLNIILPRGAVMQERVKDSPDPASV